MTTVASVYASGLVKRFGELRAVDGIDLEVRQVVWRVVGREPVLTPESGRMNVPLETADGAAEPQRAG
jgi:hypothetical protein